MGARAYWYFTAYQPDISAALDALRQQEFLAGRYFPVTQDLEFPVGPESPMPGPQHSSISDALIDTEDIGTRSILDVDRLSETPQPGTVTAFGESSLLALYDTTRPTRAMVEQNTRFFEEIDRGQAIYFLVFKDNQPDEILFAGYSFD